MNASQRIQKQTVLPGRATLLGPPVDMPEFTVKMIRLQYQPHSCLQLYASQLRTTGFSHRNGPFLKGFTRTDCFSLTMCKTWYFRQAFLFIVWSFLEAFIPPDEKSYCQITQQLFFFHLSASQGFCPPPAAPFPLKTPHRSFDSF